jgi:hypothetical protein
MIIVSAAPTRKGVRVEFTGQKLPVSVKPLPKIQGRLATAQEKKVANLLTI